MMTLANFIETKTLDVLEKVYQDKALVREAQIMREKVAKLIAVNKINLLAKSRLYEVQHVN